MAGNERYDAELIRRLGLLFSALLGRVAWLVCACHLGRFESMMSAELGAVEKMMGERGRRSSLAEIGGALSDGI